MRNLPYWIKTINSFYFLRTVWGKTGLHQVILFLTFLNKLYKNWQYNCFTVADLWLFFFSETNRWLYKKVPGQETIVRVILPLISLSILVKKACIMPDVLLPFTARRMSPHLKKKKSRYVISIFILNSLQC